MRIIQKIRIIGDLLTGVHHPADVEMFLKERTKQRGAVDVFHYRNLITRALSDLPDAEGLNIAQALMEDEELSSRAREAWSTIYLNLAINL